MEKKRKRISRRTSQRTTFVLLCFGVLALIIACRLVYLQVLKYDYYKAVVMDEITVETEVNGAEYNGVLINGIAATAGEGNADRADGRAGCSGNGRHGAGCERDRRGHPEGSEAYEEPEYQYHPYIPLSAIAEFPFNVR